MPREYGQLRHDMWSDDEFRALTVPAQHLYMLLISDPKLNYCGVTSWHAGKIAHRSGENSGRDTLIAALELCDRYFVVIDEETEEVLVRSYLRHDPLMKNPRLAVSMAKDFGTVASNKLRAAVVFELLRLKKEHPDWGAWDKVAVMTVLKQSAASARDMATDLPLGGATYLPTRLPMPLPVGLPTRLPSGFGNAKGSV